MDEKEEEIRKLVRDDYGFPVLQELLAEVIIRTQDYNSRDNAERFEQILDTLLGNPNPEKYDGNVDDTELILMAGAAYLQEKKHKQDITPGMLAAEVARKILISEYDFGDKPPKGFPTDSGSAFDTLVRRLKRKIIKQSSGEFDLYSIGEKYMMKSLEEITKSEEIEEEISFMRSLCPLWIKTYVR